MLCELNIKNIALIEKLNLKFFEGLNILSGETGAGKSIIIDSLNFVLGERADKTLIRYNTDFAVVEAVFSDYETPYVVTYLNENGIDAEEILVISRKMTPEGKNECRINGKTVTLSMLKGLTELLCDILGQHEHQSLLHVPQHINLLDNLGGNAISELLLATNNTYKNYTLIISELKRLGDGVERARKIDILTFQIEEIKGANVGADEEDELLDKRKRIRNMEKILSALDESGQLLDGYEGDSVLNKTKIVVSRLNSIASFDDIISGLTERLDSARIEIKDIADEVSKLREELNFDSRSAEEIEERLEVVRNIKRKYGGNFEAMQEFYNIAQAELEELQNADERVAKLEGQKITAEKLLLTALVKLTKERKSVAIQLENKITKELNDLGMAGSTFKVDFKPLESDDEILRHAGANGCDSVEFLISPNIGEPLKPLAKIISGGEMSRFMLALKSILCGVDHIQTMVFDEIDSGISGHIAEVVASKLCTISRGCQVLAVTHLPQLAAMADNHYLIEKHTENGKTITSLTLLSDSLSEIARLIGGSDYSGFALPHAKEMREWSVKFKANLKEKV